MEPLGDDAVLARSAPPRRGAFHRASDDSAPAASGSVILDAKEQLRRKRKNAAIRLPVQERSVVDRLPCAQPCIERRSAARHFKSHWRGEIQLIHVSGANPLVNPGDALGVLDLCKPKLRGDLWRRLCRLCILFLAAESLELRRLTVNETAQLVVECVAPRVDPKPGKRFTGSGCARSCLRLKTASALVAEESRRTMARGHRALKVGEQRRNLCRRIRDTHAQGSREHLRPRFFLGFGAVLFPAFKQHCGRRLLHQRIDSRGKGMPPRHAGSVIKNRQLP